MNDQQNIHKPLRLLSRREVGDRLGKSDQTVRRMEKAGRFFHPTIGATGHPCHLEWKVEKFIARLSQGEEAEDIVIAMEAEIQKMDEQTADFSSTQDHVNSKSASDEQKTGQDYKVNESEKPDKISTSIRVSQNNVNKKDIERWVISIIAIIACVGIFVVIHIRRVAEDVIEHLPG